MAVQYTDDFLNTFSLFFLKMLEKKIGKNMFYYIERPCQLAACDHNSKMFVFNLTLAVPVF